MIATNNLLLYLEKVTMFSGEESCIVGTKSALKELPIPYAILKKCCSKPDSEDVFPIIWNGFKVFETHSDVAEPCEKNFLYIVPLSLVPDTIQSKRDKIIGKMSKKIKK